MLAVVLGAALMGLEDQLEPPAPITGNAYDADLPKIAQSWAAAIDALESSSLLPRIFPEILIQNLALTKRQEMRVISEMTDEEIAKMTLDSV
jgi:glutamine synthetase